VQDVAAGRLVAQPLDLLAAESISAAARWVQARHGRVDVLINASGVPRPPRHFRP
jgi:NAD(P)-dependent dehydrogenase (short-subunit alcohol dehydrogenase family)